MASIEKFKSPSLNITLANYISWIANVELYLESFGLMETIKENNTSTVREKEKSVNFIISHLDESVICDYEHIKDPKEIWKSLKDQFDHQKAINLPLVRDEWKCLKFQDFDNVINYKTAMLEIVAKLRYYGDTITESQKIEKTYTTFHKNHITQRELYMLRGFTKFSDLCVQLLIAEKMNETTPEKK